jgi:lipoprotein-releasing system permease protein
MCGISLYLHNFKIHYKKSVKSIVHTHVTHQNSMLHTHAIIFIVSRYIRHINRQQGIHLLFLLSCIATIIGCASITISLSIMSGLQQETITIFRTIYGDCIVQTSDGSINSKAFKTFAQKNFPSITSYIPSCQEQVLMSSDEKKHPHGILIKAINPQEPHTAAMVKKLISQEKHNETIEKLFSDKNILVGKRLAQSYNLSVGDEVYLLYPESYTQQTVSFGRYKARISGFVATGLEDIDDSLVLCNFALYKNIFNTDQPTMITMYCNNATAQSILSIKNALKTKTDLVIYSWHDMYPAIVAAMKLEEYGLYIILATIILLLCMLISSSTWSFLIYKQHDIYILRCMGLSAVSISAIFLCINLILALIGSIIGSALGMLCCFIINYTSIITLPDAYISSKIACSMSIYIPCMVVCGTLLCAFFTSLFGHFLSKKIM